MGGYRRFRNRFEVGSGEGKHHGLMTAGADKSQQIGGGEPRRRGVLQRMAVDLGEREQRLVNHHAQARLLDR